MKTHKTIGIIGGIGAEASANLYLKMIHYCQEKYKAKSDDDYPSIILSSSSVPGFGATGIVDGSKTLSSLIQTAQKLELAGAEMIIIACNTVHIFAEEIQNNITVPLLHIVEETVARIHKFTEIETLGILCSQSSRNLKLYETHFKKAELNFIQSTDFQQHTIDQVIESVIAGQQGNHEIICLKDIIRSMQKQGAQAIVLGCTELPLAFNQVHTDMQLFNSLDIIIESAVDFSFS